MRQWMLIEGGFKLLFAIILPPHASVARPDIGSGERHHPGTACWSPSNRASGQGTSHEQVPSVDDRGRGGRLSRSALESHDGKVRARLCRRGLYRYLKHRRLAKGILM